MKHHLHSILSFLCALLCISNTVQCLPPDIFTQRSSTSPADWLVVGAGPAGLCVVGVLIDVGVEPQNIVWLDPEFNIGRIGAHYGNVPANNDLKEFIKFMNACACFQEVSCPALDELRQNPHQNLNPFLEAILEPLRCITQHLCTKVKAVRDSMNSLNYEHTHWRVGTASGAVIDACHVVLATGSRPKTLDYKTQQIIPLDIALDPQNLRDIITPQDTVAVVGDSHSAILLLKFLTEMPVKHIYNFYHGPILYATNLDGWIINGPAGLKGIAAEWAHNVLEKHPPANLSRIKSTPHILETMLPQCTKTIYAIGFERNNIPPINGYTAVTQYNATNGLIAPRLFGIGIAFPERRINPYGQEEFRIGLDSFMDYAHRLVPHWVHDDLFKYGKRQRAHAQIKKFAEISNLFSIWAL